MVKVSNENSLSRVINQRHDNYKYTGYDYKNKQIKNSVSPYLLKNERMAEIVEMFDKMFYQLTEKVKVLMTLRNFAMDRNHTKFR